jgi:hypothetical protein
MMKMKPVVVQSAPQNLIVSLTYKIIRGGVPEAYYPSSQCTPQRRDGVDLEGIAKRWNQEAQVGSGVCVLCLCGEERPLLYGHNRGGEQAATKDENEELEDEPNR